MWKLFGNKKRRRSPLNWRYVLYIALVAVGFLLIIAATQEILTWEGEDSDARDEYENLRTMFPIITEKPSPTAASPSGENPTLNDPDSESPSDHAPDPHEEQRLLSIAALTEINPDFIGWITIWDVLDYPVVRGSNNSRYLYETFAGQRNSSGVLFMDYRIRRGFDEHVCIIYGHNMRDDSMFTPLRQYTNRGFMAENPYIAIANTAGDVMVYRVFATKLTDAWDEAYTIGVSDSARASEVFPNVPADASRFLLLSTCTRSRDDDERILVYAASVG